MAVIDEDVDAGGETVDGRSARRQRNVDAVLDVVLQIVADDQMFPSIEQAATRSGLSVRSLYRYFADPGELMEATIDRQSRVSLRLATLDSIGEGPLDGRVDEFVAMRLRLHDAIGPVVRAAVANSPRFPRVAEQLDIGRRRQRAQFEAQFAPELDALPADDRGGVAAAGDLLTQVESIEFLRRHRGLSIDDASASMGSALRALLG
ncbi:MAG: TetR/AcrR family transcriptional regulator [Actinomycetota bacterium]